ncbi:hypothetical protein MNV49_004637 [Pseudohyphozyma bogoriensis]|nr:hypothetical protein MNV49_004637 [Pseudohyphozyma bogoriensis]
MSSSPVASVHRQISNIPRQAYGARGLITDVSVDQWPAGPVVSGIFSANGTQTFAEGAHPLPEIKYVLKGELKVKIGGQDYTLLPGDELVVPKGAMIGWYPCAYEVLVITQREPTYLYKL